MGRFETQREEILSSLPLFSSLDVEAIRRLAAAAVCENLPRGAVLFRRGEPGLGIHVVVFGVVKLTLHTNRGDEKVVELARAGRSFGELAIFSGKPHIVRAETLVDSKLLFLRKETVNEELLLSPQLAQNVIACLSNRLYQWVEELERYTLLSGTERVIAFLLAELARTADENASHVTLPVKKGVIASRLNLTHEHFSRILRSLSASGLIEVHGSEVHIPDVERLRAAMPDYGSPLA